MLATIVLVVVLAIVARLTGASWQEVVWGALGLLALALLAEFGAWLTSGGPPRLERRPPQGADDRTDRSG